MNPEHLRKICEEYELGESQSISDVPEGILNKNYILETNKGKYFIKNLRAKSVRILSYITAVEELMVTRGIPAICMLSRSGGEKSVTYEESTYVVYPFIESNRSHTYSTDDYERMGTLLGKIHQAGSYDIPELFTERKWEEKEKENVVADLEQYKTKILSKPEKDSTDEEFLKYIDLKLRLIPNLGMETVLKSSTLIHGDYHSGNLLIAKDTREIVGVCDWEKAEMAPRAMELARSTLYMCFDGEYEESTAFESAKNFINGYAAEYPISNEELRDGFEVRLRRYLLSLWLENHYYDLGDARGNHFVSHESRIITDFVEGNMLDRLRI